MYLLINLFEKGRYKNKFVIFPMMSFALCFVRSPKNLMCTPLPKSAFCPRLFSSAAPRPENSDSDEKNALFGRDTQITIF
jgi:hypothetical protein